MLHTIVHSDEITVWWEKEWEINEKPVYAVYCNGKKIGETEKTHYSLTGLQAETEYCVQVERIGEARVKTGKQKRKIDVTKAPYFAVGDGVTLNTAALQKAFDDCTKDDCVYLPAGKYLTGALTMHDDTELYIERGAVLQGSQRVEDYLPKRLNRFEGTETECYSALITVGKLDHAAGCTCRNIVIRGGGEIRGGGKTLCDAVIETERVRLKDYLEANAEYVKTCENDRTIPGRARPFLVAVQNCENVVFANVTFAYGAAWNVHFVYSKNIVTYGCKILSDGVWNGDGWDPDSSEDCVVFDTFFQTHDNSIAIKSGKNPEGNIINRPTRNVYVFDCRGGHCMALGSEMSGGLDGIYVWDCDFSGKDSGFGIKVTKKRGGYIRNVRVRDCIFTNVRIRCVPFNDDGEGAPEQPKIDDVYFENITVVGEKTDGVWKKATIMVAGESDGSYLMENIRFDGVKIRESAQAIDCRSVKNVTLENVEYV